MSECTGHQITNSIIVIAAAATDDEDGGGSPISRGGRRDEERGRGATERARARNSASVVRKAGEGAPSARLPSVPPCCSERTYAPGSVVRVTAGRERRTSFPLNQCLSDGRSENGASGSDQVCRLAVQQIICETLRTSRHARRVYL